MPRVEKGILVPYQVVRLEDLRASTALAYPVYEPDPRICPLADLSTIKAILVPGLAFDAQHYRLGYGKGHYDRFLSGVSMRTIGVGFKEQLSPELLPRDSWDVPVQELFLV